MKVNLGNYQSVDISMGGSMDCEASRTVMKRTRTAMMRDIEAALGAKAVEIRALWGEQ